MVVTYFQFALNAAQYTRRCLLRREHQAIDQHIIIRSFSFPFTVCLRIVVTNWIFSFFLNFSVIFPTFIALTILILFNNIVIILSVSDSTFFFFFWSSDEENRTRKIKTQWRSEIIKKRLLHWRDKGTLPPKLSA